MRDPNRTQRWRHGRDYYRQRGEAFDPGRFGVELIPDDTTARDFVVRHHYSKSYPSTSVRVGLYETRGGVFAPELVGVCTFGTGSSEASIPKRAGVGPRKGLTLGRFVLLQHVPFNAESWCLARAFAALREARPELEAVVSYSDPMEQRDETGRLITPGHLGIIYRAKGARFVGMTDPETKWLDRRGVLLDPRSLSKVRALDGDDPDKSKGGATYAAHLVRLGAPPRAPHEDYTPWLARALREAFTSIRHPGNLIYVFGPSGTARDVPATAPKAMPYPTLEEVHQPPVRRRRARSAS